MLIYTQLRFRFKSPALLRHLFSALCPNWPGHPLSWGSWSVLLAFLGASNVLSQKPLPGLMASAK